MTVLIHAIKPARKKRSHYKGIWILKCLVTTDGRLILLPAHGTWLRPGKSPELYDLDADISESQNLADAHPEIVEKLIKRIAEYDAELKANSRPVWQQGK